jgi:DNA gyrase subunit B
VRWKSPGTRTSTGTLIRFKPSSETFTNIEFDYDILAKRLRELAFLNSGVEILLATSAVSARRLYFYEGGLRPLSIT